MAIIFLIIRGSRSPYLDSKIRNISTFFGCFMGFLCSLDSKIWTT